MDGEKIFEIILYTIIIVFDIIIILLGGYKNAPEAFYVANILFIIFCIVPQIKDKVKTNNLKKKLTSTVGEICDIIICYEQIYIRDENGKISMPEAREYPVIKFSDNSSNIKFVIANESNPGEYKVGQFVKVWYKKANKESYQLKDNIFLGKKYNKILYVNEVVKTIDETFQEDEITIYHKNQLFELNKLEFTDICKGQKFIINKR